MRRLRHRAAAHIGARVTALLVLAVAVAGLAPTAQAAPSTKYYAAAISPAAVGAGISQQSFTFSLSNCGATTPGCTRASQQTLGSANIQVNSALTNVSASVSAPGWFILQPVTAGLIRLRSNATSLRPGDSLPLTVVADTPATVGAYTWTSAVKQSNDFSGTGNDFTRSGPDAQVLVGFPDHLAFVTQPSTVAATTSTSTSYVCPAPSVQVVAADGTPVTVGSAQATLLADTAFGDPLLGGTTTTAASSGVATFGNAGCSTGVDAAKLGTGYRLKATATWSYGAYQVSLATTSDSSAFDVVQVLTLCPAGSPCTGQTSGTHTKATVTTSSAGTADELELAVGVDSLASTTCLPYNQPRSLEAVRVIVDHRDKSVSITFDRYLVNQAANNGTPLFTVCFSAPWGNWVTASGTAPVFNTVTQEYEGVLPTCGVAGLLPDNPCVSDRSKNAGNETVVASIPYQVGRADPKLW